MRVFVRQVHRLLAGLPALQLAVLVSIYLEAFVIITVLVQIPVVGVPAVLTVIIPMAGIMLVQLITVAREPTAALAKTRNTAIIIVQEQVVLIQ